MRRWLLLAALVGTGCAKRSRLGASLASEARYSLGSPSAGWDRVDPGSADQAWHHPGISGTLYADSNCGERFDDRELTALADHLTWGVARGEPSREEHLILDDRAAYVRVSEGALDGVAVRVGMMVTKRAECVIDVLYFAPPDRFDQGWPDFMAVVGGFDAKGRAQ